MSFADGVWTALAVTLAEPLRKAIRDHHESCAQCRSGWPGDWCPEFVALFDLLPEGDGFGDQYVTIGASA